MDILTKIWNRLILNMKERYLSRSQGRLRVPQRRPRGTTKSSLMAERRVPMGNINKKVDKLIAKRQWDKLLHNLGETNGESKMKIAKACGVSGGSGCIDLLSVILNDREASDDLLLETIDSLGKIGNDRCITLLRYFRENVDQSKAPMISAVDSSVRKIKVRVAEMEQMTQ